MSRCPPPLRWSLPAVLLAAGGLVLALSYELDLRYFKYLGVEEAEADARLAATRTAAEVERSFRRRHPNGVRDALDAANDDRQLRVALVVDKDLRILFATDYAVEGRPLRDSPQGEYAPLVRATIAQGNEGLELNRDRSRAAVAVPVAVGSRPGEILPVRRGAVLLVFDTSRHLGLAQSHALRFTRDLALLLGGLTVLLWILLGRLVTRRALRVVAATRRISEGDFTARAGTEGSDELAQLGHAVDWMAATLGEKTAELEASERRFRQLIEHGSDVIAVVDLRGRVHYVSPSVQRVLGRTPDELVGTNLLDLVEPEDREACERAFREGQDDGESSGRVNIRCLAADGKERTIEITAYAPPELARQRQIVINGRDITAWTSLERQLREAQKMEAIGRLAGGVAHDFNNLLTAMLGYCDLLNMRLSPGSRERAQVGEIRRAAERAAALTRQLLAFGRRQMLQPTVFDLNAVVSQMLVMVERLLGGGIEIFLQLGEGSIPIRADRPRLEQVIVNLVANARDAMAEGGSLTLATSHLDLGAEEAAARGLDSGSYGQLTVSDTGTGMAADVQERIFEPFFTTKEIGKGTGLGLASVVGTVEQSGGHIRVESEVGAGTRFEILLPLAEEPPAVEEAGADR